MQFNIDLVYSILAPTLRSPVPLILASMGGCLSTRTGVGDLGLGGMMLAGSFFAMLDSWISGNAWTGLLTGIPFGAVSPMLHVVMHISYGVNASTDGMRVNLLANAAMPLLLDVVSSMSGKSVSVAALAEPNQGILQKIPMIGGILGAQNILFFLTILLVIVSWTFLYKTTLGLRMRMVSENPQATSTVGLNVHTREYLGMAMSDAFAGLGEAYLPLGQMNLFVEDMTSGRGYITVAINAFGGYNPVGALSGSLFLGFFDSLRTILRSILPPQLVMMTPYVFTLLVIIFGLKGSKTPAGVGRHVET